MARDRNIDDVIRRVHQRAAEESRPRLPLPSADPAGQWFQAVDGLLADMRRNLPAFIETAEWLLEPVVVPGDPLVGFGRGRKQREGPQASAGWRLSAKTATRFGSGMQESQEVRSTLHTYLLIDGRLLGSGILADDRFPAMLDNPQTTEMIVTLYAAAGLAPPPVPPLPEALGSRAGLAADQLLITADADAVYAFQAPDGVWRGPYDHLPAGQFATGVLGFHPPCAHRSQFYGENLQVRYGPWDGPVSLHTLLIFDDTKSRDRRVLATSDVISWLFDPR